MSIELLKKNIKKILKKIIFFKIFRLIAELFSENLQDSTFQVNHNGIKLKFFSPNSINRWRIKTFSTEEPDTLRWIDSFSQNSTFWDIGSNIGLYACYAAKKKNCKVYAFEPSVFNLHLLAKNIWINNLYEQVTIFSLPLSNEIKENTLNMSSIEAGGANSTFGENFDYKGDNIHEIFKFQTIGVPIDKIINFFNIKKPDYVKIDVDGIEHQIIEGGLDSIKYAKSILVEIDEKFKTRSEKVNEYLIKTGFKLKEKSQAINVKGSKYESTFNQIWKKD